MSNSSNFIVYNASAGSGKTYTLVKRSLTILLKSNDSFLFQKILAITFTNKAANEMKERILETLELFTDLEKTQSDSMFLEIKSILNIEDKILTNRARKVLDAILNNYTAFHITTIDSFTHKIIRSFAFDLGLNVDFEVELDQRLVINQSVEMLFDKIGNDQQLTDVLITFALQKIAEDKNWDVSKELKEFAKLLFNENDAIHLDKVKSISMDDFSKLKEKLTKENKEIEKKFTEIGDKGLEIFIQTGLEEDDFSSSALPKHFKYLVNKEYAKLKFEGRLNKNIEKDHHQTSGKSTAESKAIIASVKDVMVQLYLESKELYILKYQTYLLNKNVMKSLIPLAVLKKIKEEVNQYKEENNILLNAEFNGIISKHLTNQPAEFIYEKIGEKYRHYFIDEMQDTSVLQWQNLVPLIKNAIESLDINQEAGSLLLVGDAKQSIYRWRGGKAEQFIGLTQDDNPFHVEKEVLNLETNHRSYSNIIQFNNDFFTFLTKYIAKPAYANIYKVGNQQKATNKKGGYVSIDFIEKSLKVDEQNIAYGEKIVKTVNKLENQFDKNEICILVRTKKQGVALAEYLIDNKIDVVSSETLLLKNSAKVNYIINVYKILDNEKDEESKLEVLHFLYNYFKLQIDKHTFFMQLVKLDNEAFFNALNNFHCSFNYTELTQNSLYQKTEHIIQAIDLHLQVNAYVTYFLDEIFTLANKDQHSIIDFLNFWDLKQDEISIVAPEQKNAVQIYTVHKSKGLEFPVVIFPYDLDIYYKNKDTIWYDPLPEEFAPIPTTIFNVKNEIATLGETGEQLLNDFLEQKELDNFNILYVALTRAKEQLYIFSQHTTYKDKPSKYSHFLIDFLADKYDVSVDHYPLNGSDKRISTKNAAKTKTLELTKFVSTNYKNQALSLVASKKKKLDVSKQNAREYGNIIHELMQYIEEETDINFAVNKFIMLNIIDEKDKKWVVDLIYKITKHNKLKAYFKNGVNCVNEREILTKEGELIIPDRLVFNDNQVTIIDYKTGKKEKVYQKQLHKYAKGLEDLGYHTDKKLLVYIDKEIEVEEVV